MNLIAVGEVVRFLVQHPYTAKTERLAQQAQVALERRELEFVWMRLHDVYSLDHRAHIRTMIGGLSPQLTEVMFQTYGRLRGNVPHHLFTVISTLNYQPVGSQTAWGVLQNASSFSQIRPVIGRWWELDRNGRPIPNTGYQFVNGFSSN